MILFESEWLAPENLGAIVDYKTKNKSFLRFAALLKASGVSNYKFPLQLHDPSIQGLDPHDPNLTIEQMARIGLEVKKNIFYFIREVIHVPGGAPDDPISFIANRGNFALYWLFLNHITVILIQIRQTGKSFSTDVLATWIINYASTFTTFNLLTKDDALRATNLERLRDIERELPFYLRMRRKGDVGNTEEMHISRLNNKYKGHLPNKSPKMALNVGRGMTSPITQCDEAAFFYNVAISLPAALAAGTAACEMARRKGEPYGIILTTTAGKKDDRDGKYMYNTVQDAAIWNEKFYDAKDINELETIIRKYCRTDDIMVNCTFNHRQLGYTDEWLRRVVLRSKAKGEDAERDFGNKWTSGSQSSPLPVSLADKVRASEEQDHYAEICMPAAYVLRWYIPKDKIEQIMQSEDHILALDSSDAVGGDDCGLFLRSVKTGATVAVTNINETNLISFAKWIADFLIKYKRVLFIPERRSSAASIIDYLLEMLPAAGEDPFKRIYNKVVQEKDEFPERFALIERGISRMDLSTLLGLRKYFGFATSAAGATSRTELYSTVLTQAIETTGDLVKDPKTINQVLGLVNRNGRVDHAEGEHDDLVICLLLSFWILVNGKNLSYYGIKTRDILCENKIQIESTEPVQMYDRAYQARLREQAEDLVADIRSITDETLYRHAEQRLLYITSQLTEKDKEFLSVDQLLADLREKRSKYRRY